MDNISDRSFRKSTVNVLDNEEDSTSTAISGIVNNGTSVELDEVDLRNGINEFHKIEVTHHHLHKIQLIKSIFSSIDSGFIEHGCIENYQIAR